MSPLACAYLICTKNGFYLFMYHMPWACPFPSRCSRNPWLLPLGASPMNVVYSLHPCLAADIDLGPQAGEYIYINSIITLSAAVISYYDYALTLPREIQFLWPPHNKLGWFTLACLLNRYLPVFGQVPIVISYFVPGSLSVCHGLHEYRKIFVMALQVHAGLLCLIRVYALYGRSSLILGLLLAIGLGGVINATLLLATGNSSGREAGVVVTSIPGCTQYTPEITGLYGAVAWTGALIFDITIFSLTLYKAFTIGKGIPLLDVIVRDGAIYFSVLFIMNLSNILMLRFSPPLLKNSTATLTNVLSTILVSRLVLNLREQNSVCVGLSTGGEAVGKFQAAPATNSAMMAPWGINSVRADKSTLGMA
ncbi:hypothetical protein BJV78DRAFT_93988 [Lactifluus subvellereus]|nr:hypothetical protein BJV78DRAFT_93988 [Lactifluus subvellereus]